MKKRFLYSSLYAFLYPAFHVIYLYSRNVSEIEITAILRPLLVLLILEGVIFGFILLIRRKSHIAGFLSFLVMFSFFNYGIVYSFLREHPVLGFNLGHHIILGPFVLLLVVVLSFLVLSGKMKIRKNLRFFLNLSIGILFLFTLVNAVISGLQYLSTSASSPSNTARRAQDAWIKEVQSAVAISENTVLPDIYYIIPDMFARSDAIEQETGYDNSAFIEELRALGFYVADCSRSNYASTQLSITSSLNLNYLDQIQTGIINRSMISEPMNHSLLRTTLEQLGYKTIVFDNGFGLSEMTDADETLTRPSGFFLFGTFTPFENLVVKHSFLRLLYDVNLGKLSRLYDLFFFPYWNHVNTQKYIFDTLPDVAGRDEPKFVFVHIMMPHPPYLIREDGTIETDSKYYRESLGQPVSEELYLEGYLMQTRYVENRLTEVVSEIIEKSQDEPIIIIQGDHGIRYENRLDILNAYYVPESIKDQLYSSITPVNTFRILLNGLFGTTYELLPDESWYSVYPNWFNMEIDPEHNPSCPVESTN